MAVTKKSLISNSASSKSTSKKSTAKVVKPTSATKLATAQRTLAKPLFVGSAKTTFRVASGIRMARQINAMRPV